MQRDHSRKIELPADPHDGISEPHPVLNVGDLRPPKVKEPSNQLFRRRIMDGRTAVIGSGAANQPDDLNAAVPLDRHRWL